MPPGLMGFSQGDDQPGRFFFVHFFALARVGGFGRFDFLIPDRFVTSGT